MSTTQRTLHRHAISLLVFGAVGLGAAAALSESAESLLRRYPFDPACPWGRLANGKGSVVRCLAESEAAGLAAATPPTGTPAATGSAAPVATGSAAPTEEAPDESKQAGRLVISVGPVIADKGDLGVGKLGAPKDRYAKCVEDNGGMKGDSGEVHVRFLVRSKGIAEGVSVQKRFNVGSEAARCIAEIVDRRHVGVPDQPLVGATLIVKIARARDR
jgi:hypothetical protein